MPLDTIQLKDKHFKSYIPKEQIAAAVKKIARAIENDFRGEIPIFIGILNGAFVFCSDLLKNYKGACEISFLKLSSYNGTQSTGVVKELIGLNKNLKDRTIIIVEDIVDTGNTLKTVYDLLSQKEPKVLKTATLFLKPDVYTNEIAIDYVGMEIPNKFIVGYGLDYDELGRNLNSVYQLHE